MQAIRTAYVPKIKSDRKKKVLAGPILSSDLNRDRENLVGRYRRQAGDRGYESK